MINYKIKSVRFYQAVVINGSSETYCTSPEYVTSRRDGKDNSVISLHDKGIIIENEKELTLVSWNNIASCQFDKSQPLNEQPKGKDVKKQVTDFRNV